MSNFLQYTVFGIMFGAGYAIAATGLVVTYTTSGVFNFAQGAVGMIAAFSYWDLVSEHHVPILVALVIILVVGASIAGALVERVLMRRLHGASAERPVMVTLGLLVILTGRPPSSGPRPPSTRWATWSTVSSAWSGSTSSTRRY